MILQLRQVWRDRNVELHGESEIDGYIDRATSIAESQLAEQACENHSFVIQSLDSMSEVECLHYKPKQTFIWISVNWTIAKSRGLRGPI